MLNRVRDSPRAARRAARAARARLSLNRRRGRCTPSTRPRASTPRTRCPASLRGAPGRPPPRAFWVASHHCGGCSAVCCIRAGGKAPRLERLPREGRACARALAPPRPCREILRRDRQFDTWAATARSAHAVAAQWLPSKAAGHDEVLDSHKTSEGVAGSRPPR